MADPVVNTNVNPAVDQSPNQQQADSSKATPAETSKATEQAIKQELKKYKVKVNDVEQEIDEKELLSGYQTRKASDEKFREASELKKQAIEFVKLLKTNPIEVLAKAGHNVREIAEKYLMEQLQEETLTPEQKELKTARAKLKEIEDQKKAKEDEESLNQQTQLKEKYTKDYSTQILTALESSGLPKNEFSVKRMAYYMHESLKRGFDLKAIDVVELVKQDYIAEQKSLFSGLDEDTLIKILGDDVAAKLRKADLKKLKGNQNYNNNKNNTSPAPQKSKKMSMDEFRAKLDKIKNGEE